MNIDQAVLACCFNSKDEYIRTKLDLDDRIINLASILIESSPYLLREEDYEEDDPGWWFRKGDLRIEPGIGQNIADWGARVAEKIKGLSTDETFRLFGPAFVRTFQADYIAQLLTNMGVTKPWLAQIFTQALLEIGKDEWSDIIDNWKTRYRPPLPARGCDRVADAITRGVAYQIGLVGGAKKLSGTLGKLHMLSKSKFGRALIALTTSDRVRKTVAQAGVEEAMKLDEVIAARESIGDYLCQMDSPVDVLLHPGEDFLRILRSPDLFPGVEGGRQEPTPPGGGPPPAAGESPPAGEGKLFPPIPEDTGEEEEPQGEGDFPPIRENIREGSLNVRGFKGYGTSHTFTERKPFNIGSSPIQDIENEEMNSKKNVKQKKIKKVQVSKAFKNRMIKNK